MIHSWYKDSDFVSYDAPNRHKWICSTCGYMLFRIEAPDPRVKVYNMELDRFVFCEEEMMASVMES